MRHNGARTTKAAARFRCEEGSGTMDLTPDHRSETAGPDQLRKLAFSVMANRSKKIIERLGAGTVTFATATRAGGTSFL